MKSLLHSFLLLAFMATLAVAAEAPNKAAPEVPKVAPADAAKLVAAGKAVLVDVREPAEWTETGVAAPAVLLPKSDFDGPQQKWKDFLAQVGDKQVILYCRTGHRAGLVGEALAAKGLRVGNAGGLKDWTAAGLPVRTVEPKK